MAASAEVGKLHITLAANTAELTDGLDQAQSRLDRFATRMGITAGAVSKATEMALDAVFSLVEGIAAGFKKAVDEADKLDELAQRLGTTANELSKLSYAAQISGTPIAQFTQGIQRLSVALQTFASGDVKSAQGRTLTALGIEAVDAQGKLRGIEDVLGDLADKFSGFRDSTGKTALAINLFGESGAALIPFLNLGRAGIRELAAEADKLGISLSNAAAASAGKLNEQLDKLRMSGDTLYRQIAEQITPALIVLTDRLLQNSGTYGQVSTGAKLASDALFVLARTALAVYNIFMELSTAFGGIGETMSKFATLDFEGARESARRTADAIEAEAARAKKSIFDLYGMGEQQPAHGARGASDLQNMADARGNTADGKTEPPIIQGMASMAEAQKRVNEELQRGNELWQQGTALMQQMQTPLETYHAALEKTDKLLQANAISAETAARAQQKAALVLSNAYASAAGSIVGDLGKVFENNKAIAVATALINTYQAVTNAWANVPWPLNIAAAGAALAAGMAQVANIKSTNKSSSSGGGGSGGGGGGGGGEAVGPGSMPQMIGLQIHGSRFSRDDVIGLIEQINQAQQDGAVIRVMQ